MRGHACSPFNDCTSVKVPAKARMLISKRLCCPCLAAISGGRIFGSHVSRQWASWMRIAIGHLTSECTTFLTWGGWPAPDTQLQPDCWDLLNIIHTFTRVHFRQLLPFGWQPHSGRVICHRDTLNSPSSPIIHSVDLTNAGCS